MQITPDLLRSAVGCTAERAAIYAPLLQSACDSWHINTPQRLAAFLAQVGHESGSFQHLVEIWGPTPAQERYEGRVDLGNTERGDGSRYRGRGLIQVTGRANYREVTARLRGRLPSVPDFEATPEALAEPRWAVESACAYWDWRGLNAYADVEAPADRAAFTEITRKINGGVNGLQDRLARWDRATRVLVGQQQAYGENWDPLAAQAAGAPPTSPAPAPETRTMPLPAFVGAALPALIEAIPRLGRLFGSGSQVSERNVRAAEIAVEIVREATGAPNAQAAVEAVQSDHAARQAAADAIDANWLRLDEAGGGGIQGAGQRDAAARSAGDMLQSPSFWIALLLLPLVYMVVGSVVGLWGGSWPADVRAAIATAVVSLIVGGIMGYYYGQATSRNRTAT